MEREWKEARRLSPKKRRSLIEFAYITPFLVLVDAKAAAVAAMQ